MEQKQSIRGLCRFAILLNRVECTHRVFQKTCILHLEPSAARETTRFGISRAMQVLHCVGFCWGAIVRYCIFACFPTSPPTTHYPPPTTTHHDAPPTTHNKPTPPPTPTPTPHVHSGSNQGSRRPPTPSAVRRQGEGGACWQAGQQVPNAIANAHANTSTSSQPPSPSPAPAPAANTNTSTITMTTSATIWLDLFFVVLNSIPVGLTDGGGVRGKPEHVHRYSAKHI